MKPKFHIKTESNLAGLILTVGTLIILTTIVFEYRIAWIGVKRPAGEVPLFIFQKWEGLQKIWGWQCIGFFLQTIAFVLLLKNSSNRFKSMLWAILVLLGLLIVIAFGMTLGSYGPALEVYESQQELFLSLRGAVGSLYRPGLLGLVFLTIIYLIETFSASGLIHRKWGFIGFAFILLGIVLSFVPSLPGKTIGAVIFFATLFVGYAYWINS